MKTRSGSRLRIVAGLLLGAAVLPACSRTWSADRTVTITSPGSMATVSVPFEVRWTDTGTAPARYAVFLDRKPIAPGRGMSDVADATCKVTPGCPDASYLEGLGIYQTTATNLKIADIQPQEVTDGRSSDLVHTLTIIAMNGRDRRVGEAYWRVEFRAS